MYRLLVLAMRRRYSHSLQYVRERHADSAQRIIQGLGAGWIYPQDGWSKRAADVSVDAPQEEFIVPNVM